MTFSIFVGFLVYYVEIHKKQCLLDGIVDFLSVTAYVLQQRLPLDLYLFCSVLNYWRIETQNI
jgi:hypothetical protein